MYTEILNAATQRSSKLLAQNISKSMHRISIDCAYYNPLTFKICTENYQLTFTARERTLRTDDNGNYYYRKIKKIFNLPEDADVSRISKKFNGRFLIIEIPKIIKVTDYDEWESVCHFENSNGGIHVLCNLPKRLKPDHLSVRAEDNAVEIKCDGKYGKEPNDHYFSKVILYPIENKYSDMRCEVSNRNVYVNTPFKMKERNAKVLRIKVGYRDRDILKNGVEVN